MDEHYFDGFKHKKFNLHVDNYGLGSPSTISSLSRFGTTHNKKQIYED